MLTVPVYSADEGVAGTLVVRAHRITCNGNLVQFNAGRLASEGSCDHMVRLEVLAALAGRQLLPQLGHLCLQLLRVRLLPLQRGLCLRRVRVRLGLG